jgi:chromosome partitioning protein
VHAKILSLLCQKGGTAKTTTALNLAVEAASHGLEVAVIDLGPQVSACDRKDIRGDKPPLVAATPVPHLERAIKAADEAGADLIIVDTAGRTNDAASAAARVADIILIALQPSLIDLSMAELVNWAKIRCFPGFDSMPGCAISSSFLFI